MSPAQAERLDNIVHRIATETPRQQRAAEAREIAERWGVDAEALVKWIEAEARMDAIPCETPSAAFRVLVAGTRENAIVGEIAAARSDVLS